MVISEAQADGMLAGEDRLAEARFYQEDPEAARLTRDLEAPASHSYGEGLPALEILARFFHLTPFDRAVLLLCLASEVDPAFERLYAYIQDDVTRKYPTPHLALTLFAHLPSPEGRRNEGEGFLSAWNSFLPEAPLRRFGLISLEPVGAAAGSTEPLRLNRRIADYLLGLNRMDEQATRILRPMEIPPLLAPAQEDAVDRLERLLKSWNGSGRMPAINLVGPPGIGRRAVALAACSRLGVGLYSLEFTRLPVPGRERWDLSRLLEREAVLLPAAYYLDVSEVDFANRTELATIRELVEDLRVLLIVGSRDPWHSERGMTVVQVPKADAAAQHALWLSALSSEISASNGNPALSLDTLSQQFDFGPQGIHQAVESGRGLARMRDPETPRITADDLWTACRTLAAQPLEGLAQRLKPCYTWEDIVLPADVFRQLQEIAAQVAHRAKVYETWGFGAKLSRGRGIGVLFSGPSGTGKTMAAEVLANHLKLDLYRIDLSGVVSKYIGETEKNLRKVFDAAEQSGAILFFDEADALFGKRSEVKDSHDRYANIEVNYLLQRMEDYRGLAILATNMKSLLDQAFLRRLRFLVDFPFPDASQRLRIWQKVFPAKASVDGLDYTFLARLEIPGGNIKNIALNAAFLAASEGVPIGMAHIMHASRREYAKIDKLVLESEFGSYYAMVRR
jgi:DNA polymerase III delta prime subunit